MNEEPRKTKPNWGSIASLVIFLVFVLGRPLANVARQLFQGNFALPSSVLSFPWAGLLPLALGGVALLAGAVVIARILRVGDPPTRPPGPPLPAPQRKANTPQPPGFEPVISPLLLIVGVVGLLAFGVAGLFILQNGI